MHRELTQASTDLKTWHEFRREIDVDSMVPGFCREELSIKVGELSICKPVGQDSESLAAPRFDQGAAQELIHESRRFETARGTEQAPRVGARALASKRNSPFGQHRQDPAKVLELFRCKPRKGLEKRGVVPTAKEQRYRRACGLLLAVGMIDQHLIELSKDPGQPVGAGRR
jgi:hypothetical protein